MILLRLGIFGALTPCAMLLAITASLAGEDAKSLLKESAVQGGLIVHLDSDHAAETASLLLNERYLVQGLNRDADAVKEMRRQLLESDRYGDVSIYQYDGRCLPYADNLVNAIIATEDMTVPMEEIMRVLAPRGKLLLNDRTVTKPWPDAIDEWNHYLHGPNNNAVAQDRVVGAPRSIQWVAKPRWGRSHEEMASMSATVTAQGRVFFIVDEAPLESIRYTGDWKLVAHDAFNGVLLWKREIPQWIDHLRHFRSGPAHLSRRLVAVGDVVYVTLGLAAPIVAIDAATGETIRTYQETEYAEEILVDNGILYLVVGSSEVNRTGGGLFLRGEPEPTDFRHVMAIEAATGRHLWKMESKADEFVLPLSLTIQGEDVVFQNTAGLICVDAASGDEKWRVDRPTPAKRMGFSAPTVVISDGVLLCADRDAETDTTSTGVAWGSTDGLCRASLGKGNRRSSPIRLPMEKCSGPPPAARVTTRRSTCSSSTGPFGSVPTSPDMTSRPARRTPP